MSPVSRSCHFLFLLSALAQSGQHGSSSSALIFRSLLTERFLAKLGFCWSSCSRGAAAAVGSASRFFPLGPGVPDRAEGTGRHHRSPAQGCLHRPRFGLTRAGRTRLHSPSTLPRPRCAHGGCCHPPHSQPSERRRDPGQEKGFLTSALPPPRGFWSEPRSCAGDRAASSTRRALNGAVPSRPTAQGATAAPWGGDQSRPRGPG